MRKTFLNYAVLFGMALLYSCDGGDQQPATNNAPVPATMKLTSKDVNGTIDTMRNMETIPYTLVTSDPSNPGKTLTFDAVSIKLGEKASISIAPAVIVFDSLFADLRHDLAAWGTFDTVELKPGSFLYHSVNTFGDTKEEGYNFLVVIKGTKKQYILKGEGENPLKPIADKQLAEKAYKLALSFKPTE